MKILVCALLLGCLGVAGRMDFDDQIAEQEFYCQMVKQGHWPAYDQNINCDMESGNATQNPHSKDLHSSQSLHARD